MFSFRLWLSLPFYLSALVMVWVCNKIGGAKFAVVSSEDLVLSAKDARNYDGSF